METTVLPRSIHDVTLQHWVGWVTNYGNDLAKQLAKVVTEDERLLYESDFLTRHYAWYSNTDLKDVEQCIADTAWATAMYQEAALSQSLMYRDTLGVVTIDLLNIQFKYDDNLWLIKPPVTPIATVGLTVKEFETVQDVALIFSDLQDGNCDALYELCAMYLRTVSGAIPTLEYVKSVSLYTGLCVKRYVTETINLYKALNHDGSTDTA